MIPSKDFLIAALDVSSHEEAMHHVKVFGSEISYYKVGMELFYAAGADIVRGLKDQGKKVFLDLKLNDIPATVGKAVASLSKLSPDLLTLFTGADAVKAAANSVGEDTKLLNVTVLTSETAVTDTDSLVKERTRLSIDNGAHGIVCSAKETAMLRQEFGSDFLIVNPGIRLPGDDVQDQKRVATPREALASGASHIVMGRSLLLAEDPLKQLERVWENIRGESLQ